MNHYQINKEMIEQCKDLPQQIDSRYKLIQLLGQGAYGQVLKAQDNQTGKLYALKKILMADENQGIPATSLREISILKDLKNEKNIVHMEDVIYEPLKQRLWLVFEFCDLDLYKFIQQYKKQDRYDPDTNEQIAVCNIDRSDIRKIMYQIVCALYLCHSKRIMHRDLKPQNILIKKDTLEVKIADFGLGRIFQLPMKKYTREIETLWYRAPELLLGADNYALGVDSWSLGCVLFELYEKKPLFDGNSELDQIFKIFKYNGTPNEQTWPGVTKLKDYQKTFPQFRNTQKFKESLTFGWEPEAVDLLHKLTDNNPNKRITMKKALQHPYFYPLDDKYKKQFEKQSMEIENEF